jgi:hypothetical protein
VPRFREIIEQVLATVVAWETFAGAAEVPDEIAVQVGGHIETWSAPLR